MAVLIVERDDAVAVVTLNRPEARNALSAELRDRLATTIEDLDADPAVRVVILTGSDPAFCSGVDFKELVRNENPSAVGPRSSPLVNSTTPLIGAINGPAYTGGLELALACHFLIASERATFADTHSRLGVTPGWGLTVLLSEAVGARRAREMSVTSLSIDARTALAWGLVNHVVPHETLMGVAREMAQRIVANDERAVQCVSDVYNRQRELRDEGMWLLETNAFLPLERFNSERE